MHSRSGNPATAHSGRCQRREEKTELSKGSQSEGKERARDLHPEVHTEYILEIDSYNLILKELT